MQMKPGRNSANQGRASGGTAMRLACPQDCSPITDVKLNLNCRDEIIPILRALQHVYGQEPLRRQLLGLVGQDVNRSSSSKLGRRGMNYWEITVLAAARLGCNLDYDKLQDLAENHRHLRQIMSWASAIGKATKWILIGDGSRTI